MERNFTGFFLCSEGRNLPVCCSKLYMGGGGRLEMIRVVGGFSCTATCAAKLTKIWSWLTPLGQVILPEQNPGYGLEEESWHMGSRRRDYAGNFQIGTCQVLVRYYMSGSGSYSRRIWSVFARNIFGILTGCWSGLSGNVEILCARLPFRRRAGTWPTIVSANYYLPHWTHHFQRAISFL